MNICSCQQARQAEQELIDSGISALTLMDDAAFRIARAIRTVFPKPSRCIAYLGKGNNAGDAIAVLGLLREAGWDVCARFAYPRDQWSELPSHQLDRLGALEILDSAPVPRHEERILLLDGMLGLGARLPLPPEIAALCAEINDIRSSYGTIATWAIDMPTGIDGDTGESDPETGAVTADFTSVIGIAKKGLIADSATRYTGRIIAIPMPGLAVSDVENAYILESRLFSRLVRPRPYEMYKNQAGHVGVIAGSPGLLGAARLASEAALKAGAGLVTLYCKEALYPILAASVSPEIIVSPISSYDQCQLDRHDSMLIGPGLGEVSRQDAMSIGMILRNYDGPIVLDADGLNLAASEKLFLRENILVTPHPGEMSRLLPQTGKQQSRVGIVSLFTQRHSAAVLYKGARTIISQSGSPMYYNATGGPAMATAGQGDVLSGVCAALCAQRITPLMAGCFGAYLCGLASELELIEGSQTERSLTAGNTLAALPGALKAVAQGIL